jgi:hypothetical protein
MNIPYRVRRALRHLVIGALVLTLFASVILFCWLLWLNRYVIYSRDGAKIDFSLSIQYAPGETPVPPDRPAHITIHDRVDENDPEQENKEMTNFSGYFVTLEELTSDFEGVSKKLTALPSGTAVMLQLRNSRGQVYYSSSVATQAKFDTEKVDKLLEDLQKKNIYVITSITAFQEYDFILENERERVPYGLAKAGGSGSLWLDSENSCYWLDPTSDGTLTRLIQLITELRGKGVDEVVFSNFRFPNTDKIRFDGDKLTALTECAAKLVKTCATDTFCVSFSRVEPDLSLPAGRTRLYLSGVSGMDIADVAGMTGFADPTIQLVFQTDSGDARFDEYCVLRPLEMAQ